MNPTTERILAKARERGVALGTPVSPMAIAQFEERYGIELPVEYKSYLLDVGNGNEGPYESCLLYFFDPERVSQPNSRLMVQVNEEQVKRPFPFSEQWIWNAQPDPFPGAFDAINYGSLCVAEGGCGIEWRLIVTGPERGNIWYFCDAGMSPTVPRRHFLAWYEAWLDGERWHPNAV